MSKTNNKTNTKMNVKTKQTKMIIFIAVIISLFFGAGVIAGNLRPLKNVKITFSDKHEINVLTTKTKVGDILKENHIEILEDEIIVPSCDTEISSDTKIIISKKSDINTIAVLALKGENVSLEQLLDAYNPIVEKIVVEQYEIPFETITKDISDDTNTTESVLQEGENGLKEVTYKVKYQNDVEIDRKEISSVVLIEPVDRIVQIKNKVIVSARYEVDRTQVSGTVAEYQAYAQQRCYDYGWSDSDFDCLVALWNRESGWCVTSCNRYSGAYGIPQALPASKMASAGSDYLTNYQTQINWGLGYISSRYGSPSSAWRYFQNNGWY